MIATKYRLKPKRRPDVAEADKWQSACSVVQKALARTGAPHLSEITVGSILDAQRQKLMDKVKQR